MIVGCSKTYNEDFAVGQNQQESLAKEQYKNIEKSFTKANEIINLKEKENILSYIERRGWNMEEKHGVYIQVTKQGDGKIITDSSIVSISYDCYLLNGQRYGYPDTQQDTFNVQGDTNIPFGLFSAVKNLKKNSQARIIIPSNLSFIISDDGEKVSSDNTLIYVIEIKDVK